MKTIFTLTIALLLSISCIAQKSNSFNRASSASTISFSIEKAYPNPVKDFVNIEIQANEPGDLQMSLFNILGTEVKKLDSYYLSSGLQKLQIDLSQFKTGVYILRLSKEGQTKAQILKKV